MMRGGMTLVLTAMLLQAIGAQAATLDKDTCARLEGEQTALEKTGVRATLAKGATWAKDNLPLDKLQEVRRLIEVDEQILFRCQGKPLVLLPSSVDADPVQSTDDNGPDGEKPADGKAAPTKAAPAKDAKTPAPKAAAVTSGKTAVEAPAKKAPPAAAKPKPAPKKADDAYKPPAEPGQDPFSLQNTNRSSQ